MLIIKNNNHGSLLCNNHVDYIARSLAHSDQSVAVSDTVLRALLGLLHQILTAAVKRYQLPFWEVQKQWKQWLILFFWAPKSLQMEIAAKKLKDAYSFEGKLWPT